MATMSDAAPASSSKPEVWSTAEVAPSRQFDAWREAINDAHLSWDIAPIRCERFPAYMHQRRVDGLRLTDCTSAAKVVGVRGPAQIAQDRDAYISVAFIANGAERLRFGRGEELSLRQGMFTLWDSTRPLIFETSDNLRQISLMVPESELVRRLPRVRDLVCRPIDGEHGMGGLFIDHLKSLVNRMGELPRSGREPALDITVDLLALCLAEQPALPAPRLRQILLEQMQRHIEAALTDPWLGVATLAATFHMTERNVHKVFESSGVTVSVYIRSRRLALCRRDLESCLLASRHVGEVARHWGFNDASHFAKAFRAEFGLSPREVREVARAGRAAVASTLPRIEREAD